MVYVLFSLKTDPHIKLSIEDKSEQDVMKSLQPQFKSGSTYIYLDKAIIEKEQIAAVQVSEKGVFINVHN
ncbi:hypothetical protein CN680_18095 [Bacillus pseudomycoides]|uniref:hypothetical protein n=1 Tax=Bacillus pseudomycoides TaxID=64104 RepID=UPI000BF0B34C|nr:hypothetical protein [Bacillus pseudomycoides]PEJ74523.1 hypothetical protein CN680_18095 [Bacillus pseudomycoides]